MVDYTVINDTISELVKTGAMVSLAIAMSKMAIQFMCSCFGGCK